jgi:hypothetical protein
MALEREREYYESCKDELLRNHKGQFAVIWEEQLLGIYTTFEEALAAGVDAYGTRSFLIQEITDQAGEIQHPALNVGMLYALP